ncbi:MAG: SDR family NAD(P)-dependent oxidoreductase [Dehalococcoidia bacterium]
MELEGKTALITGSTGRGMGRSIALSLAREGANIVLNYETRPQRAEAVLEAVKAMGRRAIMHEADVASEEGAKSLYEAAVAAFHRVDILVVSAGGAWLAVDTPDLEPEHWRRVLAEEIHSPMYLLPLVLPAMRKEHWGRIILLGGHDADDWREEDAPLDYPMGKAARHWLTRSVARREAIHGITVNAIAPGTIDYVELEDAVADLDHGETWQKRSVPRPQDAGDLAAFLCSEQARFVTGSIIQVVTTKEP